jgi:hypothetical protein
LGLEAGTRKEAREKLIEAVAKRGYLEGFLKSRVATKRWNLESTPAQQSQRGMQGHRRQVTPLLSNGFASYFAA